MILMQFYAVVKYYGLFVNQPIFKNTKRYFQEFSCCCFHDKCVKCETVLVDLSLL